MKLYNFLIRINLIFIALLDSQVGLAADGPWRLNDALGSSGDFSISGVQRTRFESLHDSVLVGASPSDHGLLFRTNLNFEYRSDIFGAQLEFADARQELMDDDTLVNNGWINAAEFIQANLIFNYGANGDSFLRVGRLTTDWGSRRFIARNRFRNAINTFDGVEVHHELDNGDYFQLLLSQPVTRLPSDRIGLLDNRYDLDESSRATRFYGLQYSLPNLLAGFSTDLFYFGLREDDRSGVQTRNRNFDSIGFRLLAPPSPGEFDLEFESLFQFGENRASTSPAVVTDLDHRAFFQYAAVGYSFEGSLKLRAVFEFDYSSGDKDPFDQDYERFDSLFGVGTFEFGPTGMSGPPSNRSNIVSPGIRLFADPRSDLNLMAFYRHFWLAEKRDSWGRTGLRDTTGATDSYLGQQLELRVRWDVIPGNLRIETGALLLNSENFSEKNTRYGYLATVFTF
ncbi:MAG: alginate export family protein [Gammaproteobacteria bacterium]